MLKRKENGKLSFDNLSFEIFIGDLYAKCRTEKEVFWVLEQLNSVVELLADERIDEISESE